jgi:hypothetical protein
MKVIQLPDVLHDYLVHVIEKHAGQGIHPEEGIAVARLYEAVTKLATHIDDADVKKMAAAASPQGQSAPSASVTEPDPLPADHWSHNVKPEDR